MLELKGITKKFGGKTILDNIDLTVEDGKILTIVGPSGAGKTTLLRCISGLASVDAGQFLLDGKAFDPATNRDNAAVIGVVFQDYQLFPNLTVRQNVTLAPTMVLKQAKQDANEEADRLLTQLNLRDKADLFPYELSGGQKQRVAIVRALAMHPKLLCYDEPTSALDPDLRREVQQIIVKLRDEGITQIVVTHDIPFAEAIADQMLRVEPKD
ncbi:amino acid ABC transporter ATP-binding protein [Levilactobacillus cerevisiae]|uniref:amino acid ABC transporter ATP-binding protein n=1 Tax=Levilactobacillus cerevisiae TaxID=1704076 RepID=UPI000F79C041|nr:amino acid ABC transporter ATP-binding protein [Levilactobacillus cerevisiae]